MRDKNARKTATACDLRGVPSTPTTEESVVEKKFLSQCLLHAIELTVALYLRKSFYISTPG